MIFCTFIAFPEAYIKDTQALSVAAMDSKDREVFKSIVSDTSHITDVTSTITTDIKGETSIDKYYWTAWYNRNTKNFTIDKTKTQGDYLNGFPKSTSDLSTSTNFDKIGYYKYLRDPIYNKITLVAYQTFDWVEKVEKIDEEYKTGHIDKTTVPSDEAHSNIGWWKSVLSEKSPDLFDNSSVIDSLASKIVSNMSEDVIDGHWQGVSYASVSSGNDTYTISVSTNFDSTYQGRDHVDVTVLIQKTTKVTYFEEESHSKTIKIAETVVATNVSATELAKYASFSLVWKNSSTSTHNTSITKYDAGWWGANKPSYHNGNSTTSDSDGTYYTFSNSISGTGSYNLYNMISKKEKLFTEQAVDLTIVENPDFKYTVVVDPNGGKYQGSTAKKTISQKVNTNTTIYRPVRDGYTFLGYDYVGEGSWNSASGIYTFTGDGTLTAKWKADSNNTNSNDPNNPSSNTPQNPDQDTNKPGSPNNTIVSDTRYTLRIDPNGGKYNSKTGITTISQKEGGVCSIASPTRSGYLFDGWSVVSGNASYFTQSKYTMSSTYAFYGNATIQAKWLKKGSNVNDNTVGSAELIIDPNGGMYEGSESQKSFTQAAGTSKSINTPSRDGYRFIGWEIDTNNDVNGIFNTSSNSFIFKRGKSVLKARWKKGNPPSCIMDGSGTDACPDSIEESINKFVHLTKNIY